MSILDMKRRIHTRVDRTNLYRLGNFTDWFDLTHGLRHPRAGYRLERARSTSGLPRAVSPCSWFDFTQEQRTTQVCWSEKDRIPLLIRGSGGDVVWRVTALDRKPIRATTFVINDQGFVRNDAIEDIEGD
jgi:hypothetical protein